MTIEQHALTAHGAAIRPSRRRGRLLCGIFAFALLASVSLPVTIDGTSGTLDVAAALAASNHNGTGDGQGRGNGNGKGRGDERGGGKGTPKPGDDDSDDDDDDDHDDDGGFGGPAGGPGGGARERGADGGFGDVDEVAAVDGTDAVDDITVDGPVGMSTPALPTIQQVFSLGEDSVLSADQEQQAIENGWGAPD